MFEYNKPVQKRNLIFVDFIFFFVLRIVKHRSIIVHEDKKSSHFNLNCPSDQIMEEYLKKIWYDPRHPGSFAGPSKLYQVVKREGKYDIGLGKIKKSFYKTKTLTHCKRK